MNRRFPLVASLVASLGLLSGCCCCCCDCEDGDDAIEVQRTELPAAVLATIEREAAGGTVGDIEKETDDGRTVYTADVMINGEEWEIEVGEDGKFLGKELEGKDDEEDDN